MDLKNKSHIRQIKKYKHFEVLNYTITTEQLQSSPDF